MARTRSIKPGFFDNDILGDLPPLTRLLFIGLWCYADREGRLEDRPRKIKKSILGYDDVDAEGVSNMLQTLNDAGFIIRYEAQGERYIQVVNFVKHQNPHMKEKGSELPPPPNLAPSPYQYDEDGEEDEESTGQAPDKPGANPEQAGPITINPLPITGTPSPSAGEAPPGEEEEPEPGGGAPGQKLSPIERRFDLFWSAYPKKRAKKAAWAAFKKAKPDEALFLRMMDAIGRARTSWEWQRESGRYIPNPATWLNGGCWDDVIEEVTSHDQRPGEYGGHPGGNYDGQPAQPTPSAGKPSGLAGFKSADDEFGDGDDNQ